MMLFVAVLILAVSTIQVDSVPHRHVDIDSKRVESQARLPTRFSPPTLPGYPRNNNGNRVEQIDSGDDSDSNEELPTRFSHPALAGYPKNNNRHKAKKIDSSDDSDSNEQLPTRFSHPGLAGYPRNNNRHGAKKIFSSDDFDTGKPESNTRNRAEKTESIGDVLQTQILSRFLLPGSLGKLESKTENSDVDNLGISEFLTRLERSEVNTENSYSVIADYITNLSPENYENLKKLVHRMVPLVSENSLIGNFVHGFAFLTENRPMLVMLKNVLDVLNQGNEIVHGPHMASIKPLMKFPTVYNENTAEDGSESDPKQGETDENVVDKLKKSKTAIPEDLNKIASEKTVPQEEPGKLGGEAVPEAGLPNSDAKTEAAQLQNGEAKAEALETAALQGEGPGADTNKPKSGRTKHRRRKSKVEETPAANAELAEPKQEEPSTPQKEAEEVATAAPTEPPAEDMVNATADSEMNKVNDQRRKSSGRPKRRARRSRDGSQPQPDQGSFNTATRSVGV